MKQTLRITLSDGPVEDAGVAESASPRTTALDLQCEPVLDCFEEWHERVFGQTETIQILDEGPHYSLFGGLLQLHGGETPCLLDL